MTGIHSWSAWVVICFAGGPLVMTCLHLMYSVRTYHRHLPAILAALENSRYIYTKGRALLKERWLGAYGQMAILSGMILMPKPLIRVGDLDARDVERFPRYLKRVLVIDAALRFFCLAWIVLVYALIKLDE